MQCRCDALMPPCLPRKRNPKSKFLLLPTLSTVCTLTLTSMSRSLWGSRGSGRVWSRTQRSGPNPLSMLRSSLHSSRARLGGICLTLMTSISSVFYHMSPFGEKIGFHHERRDAMFCQFAFCCSFRWLLCLKHSVMFTQSYKTLYFPFKLFFKARNYFPFKVS